LAHFDGFVGFAGGSVPQQRRVEAGVILTFNARNNASELLNASGTRLHNSLTGNDLDQSFALISGLGMALFWRC
jgi:hypothetical protein